MSQTEKNKQIQCNNPPPMYKVSQGYDTALPLSARNTTVARIKLVNNVSRGRLYRRTTGSSGINKQVNKTHEPFSVLIDGPTLSKWQQNLVSVNDRLIDKLWSCQIYLCTHWSLLQVARVFSRYRSVSVIVINTKSFGSPTERFDNNFLKLWTTCHLI